MRSYLFFVDINDVPEGDDEFLEVDLIHDSEENINHGTKIGSDEFDCYLVFKELRNGQGSLNFHRHVGTVKMLANFVACSSQVIWVSELKTSVFLIYPASSSLHDWIIRCQVLVHEGLKNLLNGLRILRIVLKPLVENTKSIEQSLIIVSLLLLLEIVSNILHVLLKMCAGKLGVISTLAIFQRTDLFNKDSHLVLVVEFVVVVILQPHILNWVIFELTKLTLGHLEHRQGNLRKNVIDEWLDDRTWLLESQAQSDQLNAESKRFSSNELASAGEQNVDVSLEQHWKVLVSERGTELLIRVGSEVCSLVDSFSDLHGLVTTIVHLAEALCGLSFGLLLLVRPENMHKFIISLKSLLMKKINFQK